MMDHAEKDIDYWESASDSYLRNTSLRDISKGLPTRTSTKRTLALYLRWLEIHRCSDSNSTQHWVNTIMHWTQALRARGFTEEEINQGVKGWKNGKDWRVGEGRNLPTWEDVEDVFMKRGLTERESEQKGRSDMEKADQKEEKRERWRLENGKDQRVKYEKKKPVEVRRRENFWGSPEDKYAGVPYKGYICKRCGGSGHHLQVCPTNLDPSWDEPPEPDYECTVCGVLGDHFKSLCSRNTDPNCLNQKRKRAGVVTPEKKPQSVLANWERDIGHRAGERLDGNPKHSEGHKQESFRLSGDNTTATSRRQELFALDEKRNRLLAEDQGQFLRMGALNTLSTSSPQPRKRAREYPESSFGRLSLHNDLSSPEVVRKRVRFAEPDSPPRSSGGFAARAKMEEGAFGTPASQNNEIGLDFSDNEQRPSDRLSSLFPSRTTTNKKDIDMADYTDSISSPDGGKIPAPTDKRKKYSTFVLALMKRRPDMSVVVNVRRRGTAADMWDQHSSVKVEITVNTQYGTMPTGRDECTSEDEDSVSGFGTSDDQSPDSLERTQKRRRISYDHDHGHKRNASLSKTTDVPRTVVSRIDPEFYLVRVFAGEGELRAREKKLRFNAETSGEMDIEDNLGIECREGGDGDVGMGEANISGKDTRRKNHVVEEGMEFTA